MHNQMMEKSAEEGTGSTEDASIMTQVLRGSRSGHVRGMGYGVIPTSSSSQLRDAIHVNNNEECHQRMEVMQEKIDMQMALLMSKTIYNIIYFYTFTNCYNGHDYDMKFSSS
jgi:hypothetical protein